MPSSRAHATMAIARACARELRRANRREWGQPLALDRTPTASPGLGLRLCLPEIVERDRGKDQSGGQDEADAADRALQHREEETEGRYMEPLLQAHSLGGDLP